MATDSLSKNILISLPRLQNLISGLVNPSRKDAFCFIGISVIIESTPPFLAKFTEIIRSNQRRLSRSNISIQRKNLSMNYGGKHLRPRFRTLKQKVTGLSILMKLYLQVRQLRQLILPQANYHTAFHKKTSPNLSLHYYSVYHRRTDLSITAYSKNR